MTPPLSSKLLKWFLFSVFLAVWPLIPSAFRSLTRTGVSLDWNALWQHGELLLVSVALAASGLGDLLISGVVKHLKKKLVVGFMAVLIIFSATWIFADITTGWQLNQSQMSPPGISLTSWTIFGCAVLTGGCCIALSDG